MSFAPNKDLQLGYTVTSKFHPAMKLLSSFRESRRFNFSSALDFPFFDNEFNGHMTVQFSC